MTRGRKSEYTVELGERFCELLAAGTTAVNAAEAIGYGTKVIWTWRKTYPEFEQAFACARERRGESMADRLEQLASDVLEGVYDPSAARVAADQYRFLAAKLYPRVYGDHASRTVEIGVTAGYSKLLEALDTRPAIDMGKVIEAETE